MLYERNQMRYVMASASVFALVLGGFLAGCGKCGASLVGQWVCDSTIPIVIYKDGKASYAGSPASWAGVDRDTIRLEYKNVAVFEPEISGRNADGSRVAVFTHGGIVRNCKEKIDE